jgi:hypothetical protein
MDRKGIIILLFVFSLTLGPGMVGDALAEKSVVVWINEDSRCESYSARGKMPNSRYEMMRVTVRKPDITAYSYDDDRAVICFRPLGVGTTRVIINVKKYEYDGTGRLKETKNITQRFRVKVRVPEAN